MSHLAGSAPPDPIYDRTSEVTLFHPPEGPVAAAAALFRFTERPRLTPRQTCHTNNHGNNKSNT